MPYERSFKIRAVAKIGKKMEKGEEINWSEEAEELGISTGTTLKAWCQDPRFGTRETMKSLPIEKNSTRAKRPKKLVATQFACPHCGEPIALEE